MPLTKAIDVLFEALDSIVNEPTLRWSEKKALIQTKADEEEKSQTSLDEFLSWFETGEE